MPVLPISDGKGNLVPDAERKIRAVMQFPLPGHGETESRKTFEISEIYREYLDSRIEGEDKKVTLGYEEISRYI